MILKALRAVLCPPAAVLFVTGLACGAPAGHAGTDGAAANGTPPVQSASQLIDHVMPAPDSSGSAPSRFEWTAAKGADRYSIGVWSEVDVLMWRQDGITSTSVSRPADVQLAPGTYFWSVTAWREGRPIAESGRAAFVVRS